MTGELRWGVKASFLAYLAGLDDGEVRAGDGASLDDGVFTFPLVEAADVPGPGILRFAGTATFHGHGGLLDVRLADPWLEVGDGTVLTVLVDGIRMPLATVELDDPTTDGDAQVWPAAAARLTREGAALLNDVYRAGEPLDPMRVWIDFGRR